MINLNHKFKVVNKYGSILVTYDDREKARQFIKNRVKENNSELWIKDIKDYSHERS